jgi:hypothetical protein
MTHPIVALQSALVTALRADAALTALVGAEAIFDAPPRGKQPAYVVIARHDVLARDGDTAPGHEHRLLLHVWAKEASRKGALAIADRVIAVTFAAALSGGGLVVTHRQHDRTDTAIDLDSGQARAAIALRFFSEPGA